MSTKQKFLQEGGDVNLVHENEKPKVGKEYEDRLNSHKVHDQIIEAFDEYDYHTQEIENEEILNQETDDERFLKLAIAKISHKIKNQEKINEESDWVKRYCYLQKEKMKHDPDTEVLIIYRDNDIFQKFIPRILDNLKSLNRHFSVHSFQPETTKTEIKERYKNNEKLLQNKIILSDYTASLYENELDDLNFSHNCWNVDEYVDGLIKETTNQHFLSFEERMSNILKYAFEYQKPEKIIIIKRVLGDHAELATDYIEEKLSSHQKSNYQNGLDNLVAEGVESAITLAGIEKDKIEIIEDYFYRLRFNGDKIPFVSENDIFFPDLRKMIDTGEVEKAKTIFLDFKTKGQNILNNIDQPGVWIITDRHTGICSLLKNAVGINLPSSDCITSLIENKIIPDTLDIYFDQSILYRSLENNFGIKN